MNSVISYGVWCIIAFVLALVITPIIKKIAIKVNAVDEPDKRKVHTEVMPRMGGLAICIAFLLPLIAVIFFDLIEINSPMLTDWQIFGFILGGLVIIVVGLIDDKFHISAKYKLLGQIIAAVIVISFGIKVNFITLPYQDIIEFGWLSIPITLLWVIGVTNALNLIDGLDGLAAGVASIALATISIIGFTMGNIIIAFMAMLLLASTLGFLVHNFYPAKIFMGDTGALFLGYNLAVFSILGFKHVTLVSFIIPIIILAVPIADTLFAIARRFLSNQAISEPDKNHLHHCLLKMGYSHRTTVLMIYGISIFFSLIAIFFTQAKVWLAFTVLGIVLIMVAVGADIINILNRKEHHHINILDEAAKVEEHK